MLKSFSAHPSELVELCGFLIDYRLEGGKVIRELNHRGRLCLRILIEIYGRRYVHMCACVGWNNCFDLKCAWSRMATKFCGISCRFLVVFVYQIFLGCWREGWWWWWMMMKNHQRLGNYCFLAWHLHLMRHDRSEKVKPLITCWWMDEPPSVDYLHPPALLTRCKWARTIFTASSTPTIRATFIDHIILDLKYSFETGRFFENVAFFALALCWSAHFRFPKISMLFGSSKGNVLELGFIHHDQCQPKATSDSDIQSE